MAEVDREKLIESLTDFRKTGIEYHMEQPGNDHMQGIGTGYIIMAEVIMKEIGHPHNPFKFGSPQAGQNGGNQ